MKIRRLADMIANELQGAPARPKLRLIKTEDLGPPPGDAVTRMCRLDRIRWLASTYNVRQIVTQHTFGRTGIDVLDDRELCALHAALETARECFVEGIPLDEVPGLIRNIGPSEEEWDAA